MEGGNQLCAQFSLSFNYSFPIGQTSSNILIFFQENNICCKMTIKSGNANHNDHHLVESEKNIV